MSSTESDGSLPPGPHPYFRAIEETFIELRGAPLELSPSDWRVSEKWYREGIPLELIRRVLTELFERRREREEKEGRRRRGIVTLRYCKSAVERAWKKERELQAPARHPDAESIDVPPRLAALAGALPAELAGVDRLAERIRGLDGDAEEVEERLADLDRELLAVAEEGLDENRRGRLESRLEGALDALRARLPTDELERSRARLREQLLRDELGLPVLSLFSPEALPGESEVTPREDDEEGP